MTVLAGLGKISIQPHSSGSASACHTALVFGRVPILRGRGVKTGRPSGPVPAAAPEGRGDSVERRTVILGNGEVVGMATWSERAAVRMIESVVVAGLVAVELVVMAVLFFANGYWGSWSLGQASRAADRRGAVALAAVVLALTLLLPVAFEAWRNCRERRSDRRGRGGVRLIRVADGEPPSLLESAARALLPIGVSSLAYSIGLLFGPWSAFQTIVLVGVPVWFVVHGSALAHRQRRGWADLLAGTVVIPARQTVGSPHRQ